MDDLTCIVRRPASIWRGWTAETVICGRSIVEGYLRCGYEFDWHATDAARAKATTSSPDASPDSGEAERLADELDKLSSSHRPLLTAAANELRRLVASPASLSGGAEKLGYTRMGSGGRCDWQQLREAVAEAVRGTRETTPFDPTFYPGHQTVEGINYNSLDRIVTAFVDAALHPSPEAPANRQEAGE